MKTDPVQRRYVLKEVASERRGSGKFLRVAAFAGALPAFTVGALAQESREAEHDDERDVPSLYLEPITVVAPQYQRPATATVIERGEIEAQNNFVAYDVLKFKPGLHSVQRLGLTGSGLSRLAIRGLGTDGPAGLQVLIDGRPDATVSFAHPTPSAMHLVDIKTVEVIHGPSPVLHGAGLTGVVNLVTATPQPGLSGFYRQSFGEDSTVQSSVRLAFGGERGYARISGSYRETDGYLDALESDVSNASFKAGYRLSERWGISLATAVNKDSFGIFGDFFVPGPFTDPRTQTLDLTQTVFDLTATGHYDDAVASIKLWGDELDPRSQVLDEGEERADVFELGLKSKLEWEFEEGAELTVGLDALRVSAENSPVLPPFGGPGLSIPRDRRKASLNEFGVYGFLAHDVSDTLEAEGGVRLIEHSEYGTDSAEEFGLIWHPSDGSDARTSGETAFRARYTRGYQSPTLQQLFGIFRGGVEGPANPDLGAERLRQFELGINRTGRGWELDMVVFRQRGDDLISRPAPAPPPPPDIRNSVEFDNHGLEARFGIRPTSGMMLHAGVTLLDLDLKDRFARVPERTFDLMATYHASVWRSDDLSVHLAARYADEFFDVVGRNIVELESHFALDAHVRFDLASYASLFLSAENLADQSYELVAGVPARPRTMSGGYILRF